MKEKKEKKKKHKKRKLESKNCTLKNVGKTSFKYS